VHSGILATKTEGKFGFFSAILELLVLSSGIVAILS
jgi:hypothetical protein